MSPNLSSIDRSRVVWNSPAASRCSGARAVGGLFSVRNAKYAARGLTVAVHMSVTSRRLFLKSQCNLVVEAQGVFSYALSDWTDALLSRAEPRVSDSGNYAAKSLTCQQPFSCAGKGVDLSRMEAMIGKFGVKLLRFG